jgi:PAS domain S-box-containing protein
MISCHGLDGRYLYASQAAQALLGYPPRELVGRQAYELFHPEDVARIRASHETMLDTGEGRAVTYRLRHRDGRYVWVETTSRIADDGVGRGPERQIVAVTRDATARMQAEQALRESETRFRQIAEQATDMISRHDAEGRFTYLSPACRRILGYEPEQLVGRRPRVIAHPDDRDAVIQSLARLRSSRDVVSTTYRAIHRDGSTRWLESSSRNEGAEIVVVTRDMTDRLEAEQRLKLIELAVEHAREGVVITDNVLERPGPKILFTNPAFREMTGYGEQEILGRTPRILQGPQTDPAVIDRFRHALRRGEPFIGETINYRKDGSAYVVEWNTAPLTDRHGRITHWVAVQRDITARKDALELARLHREELAHATRLSAMGEMASGLAHELNQPLAAIRNYLHGTLNRLETRPDDLPPVTAALAKALDQSDRAAQIIRRIRGFVGKRTSPRSAQAIDRLVAETLALAEPDLKKHGAVVESRVPEGLPPVCVDGIQIEQVLLNLIRNAVEAMEAVEPAADRKVEIDAAAEPDPPRVQLTVRDHGPGLTDEQQDHLFHPFYTTKRGGMGMGLTISQSIVHAHDGRLWASPHPEGGTVFHLVLPVGKTPD